MAPLQPLRPPADLGFVELDQEVAVSIYAFLEPGSSYPLPPSFDFDEYIETERELWALFPETDGKRVNFVQVGLTATIYTEVFEDGAEVAAGRNLYPHAVPG